MTLAYVLLALLVAGGLIYPQWRARSHKPPPKVVKTDMNNSGAETAPEKTGSTSVLKSITGRFAETAGKLSVTISAYLVLVVMIIMFQILPRDLIALGSGIVMLILVGMMVLSVVMLFNGRSKLAWIPLLLIFGALAWQTPETTAAQMVATGTTLKNEGVRGMAPSLAPAVPDFIYQSPEEKAAARKAEVEERKHQAELAAAAIVPPPTRTEALDVRKDCGGNYAKLTNCRNVYFGQNEKYTIRVEVVPDPKKQMCPRSDPKGAGEWVAVAPNQFEYIPHSAGARVTFYERLNDAGPEEVLCS